MIRPDCLPAVSYRVPTVLLWGLWACCLAFPGSAQSPAATDEPHASTRSCSDLRGRWQTNIGATVHIDSIDPKTGQIDGSYQPASLRTRHFPLSGFVNAAREGEEPADGHYAVVLSFSVSFLEYGGITNWTGICREADGQIQLETQDLVARPVSEAAWAHVIASHDLLTPIAPPEAREPTEDSER